MEPAASIPQGVRRLWKTPTNRTRVYQSSPGAQRYPSVEGKLGWSWVTHLPGPCCPRSMEPTCYAATAGRASSLTRPGVLPTHLGLLLPPSCLFSGI